MSNTLKLILDYVALTGARLQYAQGDNVLDGSSKPGVEQGVEQGIHARVEIVQVADAHSKGVIA